jgi:hypothetical protein
VQSHIFGLKNGSALIRAHASAFCVQIHEQLNGSKVGKACSVQDFSDLSQIHLQLTASKTGKAGSIHES